jgi:Zn-dependent protease with chaperone function
MQKRRDFFERQDHARRMTVRLMVLFVGVFVMLTAGTFVALCVTVDMVAVMVGIEPDTFFGPLLDSETSFQVHPEILFASIFGTGLVLVLGAMVKTRSLKGGGASVAERVGATEVNASSGDAAVRRYVNVVEEMALSAGLPVPRVFVLPRQPGINAFAAGFTANDAAIAITDGALRKLTRDELQAVVAHEFSHILHGDMRLNVRLIGVLHGVLCIYLLGISLIEMASAAVTEGGSDSGVSRGQVNLFGLLLAMPGVVLAGIGLGGLMGSRVIKAGITRQREFLADASALQFTRNPEGLVGALKKIGGSSYGSELRGRSAEEVSHMCFGEASSTWLTHPSLEERVQALDPTFNPDLGFLVVDDDLVVEEEEVLSSVGQISPDRLVYSAALISALSEPLVEARTSLAGAVAIAYLLLIDGEKETRRAQAQIIQEEASASIAREAQRLWPAIRRIDDELRLPLMDLVFPVLRQMTREQYEEFVRVAERLIHLDGKISFREFILERVVLHRLRVAFDVASRPAAQFHSFSGVQRDLETLLSAMAYTGSEDLREVRAGFEAGRKHLPEKVLRKVEFRAREQWSFEILAASMERLSLSSPRIKRALIDACAHCVMADEQVVVAEAELLRALCDVLDVPLPPIVRGEVASDSEETVSEEMECTPMKT